MPPGAISPLRLGGVLAFGFTLTLISNTLEPGALGYKVLQLVPRSLSTALDFTSFAGLVAAMVVEPVVGALSHRPAATGAAASPTSPLGQPSRSRAST